MIVATILCTFLLAGAVKGVIGLGLPTVSLGLLTAALDLPTAMALLLVPSFVTNLWQALVGGNAIEILRRIWPFLLMASATVWIGARALTSVDLALLSALLGFLLVAYAVISLGGIRLAINPQQEVWVGPLIGTANGVLTGMTGSFVVPGVMFLQAIGLPRDRLIQAMGMLFTGLDSCTGVGPEGQQPANSRAWTSVHYRPGTGADRHGVRSEPTSKAFRASLPPRFLCRALVPGHLYHCQRGIRPARACGASIRPDFPEMRRLSPLA